jgi:hypothetical protein
MDKVFAFILTLGTVLSITSCGDDSRYVFGTFIEVENGFYKGCRGALIAQTENGYVFSGDCMVKGMIVGPVQAEVRGATFRVLE